jgi:signal transduction histidine kinase
LPLAAPALELSLHCAQWCAGEPPNRELFASQASEREGLARLVERLQARLGPAQVQSLAAVPDHRPECGTRWQSADPARLTQVLGNLLHNACKFTERGGCIRLTIEPDGDQAVIRVEDNGVGIAAEHLAHIFDMFAQIDESFERSSGGLGLGLTLVKTLIEKHGGSIEVRSDGAGRGTEFVVRMQMLAERSA